MGLTVGRRELVQVNEELVRHLAYLVIFPGADYKAGRFNEGDRDLNRDFPTWRDINSTIENMFLKRQPETQVLI
jgi:hypothetical protein